MLPPCNAMQLLSLKVYLLSPNSVLWKKGTAAPSPHSTFPLGPALFPAPGSPRGRQVPTPAGPQLPRLRPPAPSSRRVPCAVRGSIEQPARCSASRPEMLPARLPRDPSRLERPLSAPSLGRLTSAQTRPPAPGTGSSPQPDPGRQRSGPQTWPCVASGPLPRPPANHGGAPRAPPRPLASQEPLAPEALQLRLCAGSGPFQFNEEEGEARPRPRFWT